MSRSLALAESFLGQRVVVVMDRPLGSHHPRHGFVYRVNYGYVPGTLAPDGAPLDAYSRYHLVGYTLSSKRAVWNAR